MHSLNILSDQEASRGCLHPVFATGLVATRIVFDCAKGAKLHGRCGERPTGSRARNLELRHGHALGASQASADSPAKNPSPTRKRLRLRRRIEWQRVRTAATVVAVSRVGQQAELYRHGVRHRAANRARERAVDCANKPSTLGPALPRSRGAQECHVWQWRFSRHLRTRREIPR